MITKIIFHLDARPCPCFSNENSSWTRSQTGAIVIQCKTCKTTVYSIEHADAVAIIDSESSEPARPAPPAPLKLEPLRGLDGKPLP